MSKIRGNIRQVWFGTAVYALVQAGVAAAQAPTYTLTFLAWSTAVLWVGFGVFFFGAIFTNLGLTPVGLHQRHAGSNTEARARACEDVSHFSFGALTMLIGVALVATGWFASGLATCGRLLCA